MEKTTIDGLKTRAAKKQPMARSTAKARSEFTENTQTDWAEILEKMGADEVKEEKAEMTEVPKSVPQDDLLGGWDAEELTGAAEFLTDNEGETGRRKRKKHTGLVVFLVILTVLIGAGLAVYVWGDNLISRLTGGTSGLLSTISAMVSDAVPFRTDENGRTNVLIFGTEGYNMSGETGDGTHAGAQLTDSIMVVSFDQETKDVALLSLPRDLKVPMACSAGKINEVFWCHNQDGEHEQKGATALMEQVGEILGIEMQYYAHVNWGSLVYVIDRLGGVTVTLDEDINDPYWTGAVAQAGVPITVNGEQALGLARARHGTAGGDFTRGNTQQKIVAAMVQKVLDDGLGAMEALDILNNLGDNLRSNFSTDNIKAAAKLVSGFAVDQIRQVPLIDYDKEIVYVQGAEIEEISYVVPVAGVGNFRAIQRYVAQMFASDPVVREGARIAVLNGTEGYGVASAERLKLEEEKFNVVRVGDAETGSCLAKYCVYTDGSAPLTAARLQEKYGVEAILSDELDEQIVIVIGQVPNAAE